MFQNQGWKLTSDLGLIEPVSEGLTLWKAIELCLTYPVKERGQVRSWLIAAFAALEAGSRALPSTTEIPLKLKGGAPETPEIKNARANEPKRDLTPWSPWFRPLAFIPDEKNSAADGLTPKHAPLVKLEV